MNYNKIIIALVIILVAVAVAGFIMLNQTGNSKINNSTNVTNKTNTTNTINTTNPYGSFSTIGPAPISIKEVTRLTEADIIDTDAEMKVFESMLKSDSNTHKSDFDLK